MPDPVSSRANGFQPGNSYGAGRPKGRPNIRSEELRLQWESRGFPNPVDFYGPIVTDPELPIETKIAAYNSAAPMMYPKIGAIIPTPDPVVIVTPVEYEYPNPQSPSEARANIAHLDKLARAGEIDLVSYTSLKTTQDKFLYSLIDEQKLLTAQGGAPQQIIKIEGGLPQLPGTNVIMPDLSNGNLPGEPLRNMNGHGPTDDHTGPQPSNDEP